MATSVLRLEILASCAIACCCSLAWAAPVSGMESARLPIESVLAPSAAEVIEPELPYPADLLIAAAAVPAGDREDSLLADSQPQGALFLPILFIVLAGALVQFFRSAAFYTLVSDACLLLTTLEHGERDWRR